MEKKYISFKEFYPFYLSHHSHPLTKIMHMSGVFLVVYIIIITIFTKELWLLLGIPIGGYGPSWIGHFFIEKNKPATFHYPLYSILGDFVMCKDLLTGKLKFK